ncbi:hypothetical protein KCU77_g10682, partial [Aureobasidium melanogenum]
MSSGCSDIFNCASCRQAVQTMEDTLSRHENYDNGGTGNIPEFVGFQERPEANDRQDDQDEGKYCLEDECGGIKTCALCQYEKGMEKAKRVERGRFEKSMRRFDRLGQCDGPDPDEPWSDLPSYGLGCRFLDCKKCRMVEAKVGPKMRNDELRRRRVENIKTSLNESSDGTMTGASRKRRFSNLDLHYSLLPQHRLAKRIREEKYRERLERERARAHHERPSWFGTPQDPLPDLWMGRPILSEEEIDVLKVLDSLPRFYLSQSEEDTILFAQSEEDKRYCTIIRRLEAELMSRDFWMQSLGFDADDGFGNFPAGDYRLVDAQSTPSAREQEPTCVQRWASNLPRF